MPCEGANGLLPGRADFGLGAGPGVGAGFCDRAGASWEACRAGAEPSLGVGVADVVPVNVAETDLQSVADGLGMKEGFDVGLEMSGSQAALDQMVEALVMGGHIAMLGIPPGKSPVDWSRIVFKAITIKGVYGREIFETWYKMIAMLENGLDVSQVITHRFSAEDFKDGFAIMRSGQSGKVVLDWG